jgi:lipoic acid synthetase
MSRKLPDWLKIRPKLGKDYREIKAIIADNHLHTVCTSALCPNIFECFESRTATFLLMGDLCTRNCRFCNIRQGTPEPLDPDEPRRVAEAIRKIGLEYAVVTSVSRDDLPDGGAGHFSETVLAVRAASPRCRVEVLIPDFNGSESALDRVIASKPAVINHNIETVPRLYPEIRPQADYRQSLALLASVREKSSDIMTKSGFMIGLGENEEEIRETIRSLNKAGCQILTVGQYLRPSRAHYPVQAYYQPEFFDDLKSYALSLGFRHCEASPLVRSSYGACHAARVAGPAG